MRKELEMLSAVCFFVLIMLFVPSLFPEELFGLAYLISLLLPLATGVMLYTSSRGKDGLLAPLIPREGRIFFTLPVIVPTLFIIIGISYLTSLLIFSLTGKESIPELPESLPLAILIYAFLPSVMEELLFRYLPMLFIGKDSPRLCILASAVFFALVHHSFFSIPYAFFAGLVFMALDLYAGSIYPSLIAHFLNNLISVLWILYSDREVFVFCYFGALISLSLVSVFILFAKKESYLRAFRPLSSRGEKIVTPPLTFMLIFATLFMAILELV